jgi:predicted NACHT family NTPase
VAFEEVFARHRGVVVLGDPGSGKTTLLRWLSVVAAGGRFAAASQAGISERLLPLLVSVGRLAEVRRSFPGERAAVPDALARYFHDRGAGEERALRAVITRELQAGRCLVLLDGLDEVGAGERGSIHRWLEAFAAAYPASRVVATSRAVGYAGFRLPEGIEIELRPFDEPRIERYVHALHRAWTRWEIGAEATGEADAEAEKLLDAIHAGPRLGALARNPFLLSALALIHRAEGRLPRHRVQAYELFARALCETWAEARRLVSGSATWRWCRSGRPRRGGSWRACSGGRSRSRGDG